MKLELTELQWLQVVQPLLKGSWPAMWDRLTPEETASWKRVCARHALVRCVAAINWLRDTTERGWPTPGELNAAFREKGKEPTATKIQAKRDHDAELSDWINHWDRIAAEVDAACERAGQTFEAIVAESREKMPATVVRGYDLLSGKDSTYGINPRMTARARTSLAYAYLKGLGLVALVAAP